ncbi:hypothetical protein J2Y55_000103 [Bosea sp. BE125]|uniref:flagellar hook-length control protein FliK n=1 Tax=Bosea sp. BE125 TaxID=2817909 RepID=UPI00285E99F8|nr:flagellar hook-length control protein FliK [Bosea sp. BE125]MDR6869110.1 hypothetical protein [Bosea sp. BE125]
MSSLETPALPQARTAANTTGKDAKARGGIGGREERGSAFRALLQSVTNTAPQGKLAPAEKGAEVAFAESGEDSAAAGPDVTAAAATPPQPEAATSPDAAARLLLGALQTPARDAPEPRKEPTRRDASLASLSSALAQAGRMAGADTAKGTARQLAAEQGPAMPSDDEPGPDLPGSTALSQLNDLIDDKAGATEAMKDDGQPAKPLSISITRQETYLPPVMRLSPFQQVVEPIRQAAVDLAASRAEAVPELGSDKPNEISAPTKILHIELRPVELGSITVKLRLSQGGMEIRLEASRAETAQMLANDKDALREVIKASGYSIDAVSVETVHIDAPASDRQAGQGNASNERPGGRDGDGRGFDQSRQGEHRQEPRQRGWVADIASSKDESHDLDDARSKGRDPSRYL